MPVPASHTLHLRVCAYRLDQCGVPYAYGTGASKCPSDQSTGAADSEEHGGDGGEAETEGYEEDDEDDEEDDEEDGEEEGEGEVRWARAYSLPTLH